MKNKYNPDMDSQLNTYEHREYLKNITDSKLQKVGNIGLELIN